jgi:hypothetical protein
MVAARLQRRQHRLDVLLHEQHGGDDDVGPRDVVAGRRRSARGSRPVGGGMQRQRRPGSRARSIARRARPRWPGGCPS